MSHKRIRSVGLKGFARARARDDRGASVAAMANARSAAAAPIYVDVDPDRVLQDLHHLGRRRRRREGSHPQSDIRLRGRLSHDRACVRLERRIVMATATDAAPLSAGAIIGPASSMSGLMAQDTFSNNPPTTTSEEGLWDDGLTAFLGFSFANASGTHYGWARVKVDEMTNVITVFDAAYEDAPDTAIAVDQVPGARHGRARARRRHRRRAPASAPLRG